MAGHCFTAFGSNCVSTLTTVPNSVAAAHSCCHANAFLLASVHERTGKVAVIRVLCNPHGEFVLVLKRLPTTFISSGKWLSLRQL